jgi:glycosyltransferase involved in cell wall biosynthesis
VTPLSVVIPVYNEAPHLAETIEALLVALAKSGFKAEVVLVDDGSTDGSAEVARDAADGRVPLRVLSQPNSGRFEARRAGVEAADGELVLLLDGRVRIDAGALAYVQGRCEEGARVWTAHVDIDADGDLFGVFWRLIAELAWSDYFDEPRETSFGAEDFDRFPKGTTCFLAPRQLLLEAITSFQSRYADLRSANDDTPLLRWIAQREEIHVSPAFSCVYRPRTALHSFVRHALHRGVVFVDGHGRRESRFFPVVLAFYPSSLLLTAAAVRRPVVVPVAVVATSGFAAAFGIIRRRAPFEVLSLAALTPIYAVAHGAGMWRGLALLVRERR